MHRSPRPAAAPARAWIDSTDGAGTDLAVHGHPGTLRLDVLPDPDGAAAVHRGVDRVVWQSLSATGGEVYTVTHRRPRRLRVTAATALGLLATGVPTVVRQGAPA